MRAGGAPARPKAFHTVAPSMYSPVDHVVSWPVASRDSIRGGATKSSTIARSPTRGVHGNSPTTATTSALAFWKWR